MMVSDMAVSNKGQSSSPPQQQQQLFWLQAAAAVGAGRGIGRRCTSDQS
jgi:hypothetical protein